MNAKWLDSSTVVTASLAVALCAVLPAGARGLQDPAARRTAAGASLPSFDRTVFLETEAATSANASIGDVNGDGHPDIVLAKGRHWPLVNRVLLGDGRGGFSPGDDLGTASDRTYSGLLVDVDGDGDLDVIISNDRPDPKRVYLNDGAGRFRVGSSYGRPEWPTRNAAAADIDGDGLPDVVVANRSGGGGGANYICLNAGGGRFADCVAFAGESATTITPADVNGDGLTDLVVPHRDGGQSQVYLHEGLPGTLSFQRVPFGPADATIRASAAADLDGDGRVDLVAIDERTGAAIFYGERGGRFGGGVALGDPQLAPYALALGDLDLDGAADVVVGYVRAPSVAYVNDGTGRSFHPVPFGDGEGTVYGFAIGDLNGDGRPDIAAARSGAPNVAYLAGPASGEGR